MNYTTNIISDATRFWFFLTALVPSSICSMVVIYHLLCKRIQRRAIRNHVIIILLCNNLLYELIDIPLFLSFYYLHAVRPDTPRFCIMWVFIDETLSTVSTVLVAWASIERYYLIFHAHWFSNARQRLLFHYVPLVIVLLYVVTFHSIVILFPPCINTYDYTREKCGEPLCFHDSKIVGIWDTIVNDILPTLTIVIYSIALLLRSLIQNGQMHRPIQWRRYRTMSIQLLSISFLFLILYVPVMIIHLVQFCCTSKTENSELVEIINFLSYFVIFLLPFVCGMSLRERRWNFQTVLFCWHLPMRTVHPLVLPVIHVVEYREGLAKPNQI